MKKYLLLLFTFSVAFWSAQSFKVLYEMSWKPQIDSPKTEKEMTALSIQEKGISYFESYDRMRIDSIKTSIINENIKAGRGTGGYPSYPETKFRKVIIKNLKENNLIVEEKLYVSVFSVKQSCPMNWKLAPLKPKRF